MRSGRNGWKRVVRGKGEGVVGECKRRLQREE